MIIADHRDDSGIEESVNRHSGFDSLSENMKYRIVIASVAKQSRALSGH